MKERARNTPVRFDMSMMNTFSTVSPMTTADASRARCEANMRPTVSSTTPKASHASE